MPRFQPEPPYRHGTPGGTAVVIANLGTPEAPDAPSLRRYLKQFLSDPRVVEIPKPIWWLILNGIILNVRPKKSAAKYASIWMDEGSPLRVHTERQADLLQTELLARGHQISVHWAMRYGQPAISRVFDQLKSSDIRRILLLPMYPQYAASTTATVIDEAARWLLKTRNQPEMRFVRNYHDDVGYLDALALSVQRHWQQVGRPGERDRLLLSFHGLPKRSLDLGDPYFCECHKTGRLLAERLDLPASQYQICFQSRFGKAEWLQPYTAPTLQEWGKQGIRRVDVICPGFSADCLETLEEIAQEGREDFLQAGGQAYHYIPALNEDKAWIQALANLTERHLAGWETRLIPDPATLTCSLQQAKKFGASA